jgi:hypothetical protein
MMVRTGMESISPDPREWMILSVSGMSGDKRTKKGAPNRMERRMVTTFREVR